jgi:hypothetical protein
MSVRSSLELFVDRPRSSAVLALILLVMGLVSIGCAFRVLRHHGPNITLACGREMKGLFFGYFSQGLHRWRIQLQSAREIVLWTTHAWRLDPG